MNAVLDRDMTLAGTRAPCILMVEDDPNDAELIRAYLAEAQRSGAEVLHARTLAEGLRLLESRDVQLTLLDLDLPDSHGFHTLERMRAAAAGPVVVISGNGHPSLVDEVLKRRAYDVIPKHELDAATLRRVLRLATLHQESGRALRTTEGRYRALLESSSEALVLLDAAGRVEYASAALRRLLGYDSPEVLGRFGLGFVLAEDRERVQAAFSKLLDAPGAEASLRLRFAHKVGGQRLLECTLANRLGDAEVAAVVCSYRDLSREEEHRERFDATFEHAPIGLAHVDLHGRIRLANRRLCEMLGFSREELLGRTVRELSHPEDIDATREQRARLRAGDIAQFSARKRYLRKDGATVWVQLTVSIARDARSAPLYDIAAFEDVTQFVQKEQALIRFRAGMDASADMILLIDPRRMRYVDVNESVCRTLGYSREELLSMGPHDLLSVPQEELRRAYAGFAADPSSMHGMNGVYRCRDGSLLPFESTRRLLQTEEGPIIVAISRDVSERLRSEARLRLSNERFETVSRATNDVVWDWNLLTSRIWWSDNFQKLFGYAPQDVGDTTESWTARIHPEDLARVKSEVDQAIASGAKAWAGEYRFRCEDGSYVDIFDRGLLMHDTTGRAVRMIGAMMDVSERKHAERRVRQHAERQAAIARFGQFALGKRSAEELRTAAARALHQHGIDAVCVLQMFAERGEYLVSAAQGEGPHAALGQRGPIAPDSVWAEVVRENAPRIAGRAYLASRPLDRPWRAWIRTMGSAVYAPVRGDDSPDALLCVYSAEERAFGAEDVRFVEAVGHVLSTALQRQKAEERLSHLAQFDALTGLPNRTLLHDRLAQTLVQSRRRNVHAATLFVDLDRFKLINDTLGHHQGDELIRQVGRRLIACVRAGDTVGRISGDEFAVVLSDLARADDAALVAQKILDALQRPFDLGGNEAYISASIGIAVFPEDSAEAETLLKNADIAMYRAKESARNSYRFFTAEMNQRTVARGQLNTDLRHAIERGEFALHYQPKVDLAGGALTGFEALLRWNHPQRGLVSPAEFIPALEDSGLSLPVGEWVIGEACAQLRRWQEAGRRPVPVAVNLSPKQFRRGDLERIIAQTLARADIAAALLELEITESCLMEDPEDAVRAMHNLRAAGLRISIDDFGTGYSSLSYLTRLPLSALKIDRSFVREIGTSKEAASIVRAVIDMAQNLHFTVIAEGVETQAQVEFLRQHGCEQAQGYHFGQPAAAAVAGELLAGA
jgi:diguanylate cyclase (GGDEF)-like protein/PAS domain S-box-containing protein